MVLRDAAAAHTHQHAGPAGTDKDSRAALPETRRRRECCLPTTTPPTSSSSKSSNTPLLQSVTRSRRRSGENEPVMFSLAGERMMSAEEYSALPRSIQYVFPLLALLKLEPAALDRVCAFACLLHVSSSTRVSTRPHVIRAQDRPAHARQTETPSILPLQYWRCGVQRCTEGSCILATHRLTGAAGRNTSPTQNECASLSQVHLRHYSRHITAGRLRTDLTPAATANPLQNQVISPLCLTTGNQTQTARPSNQ